MRKILFRGKRLDNGEWVEGYFMPRPNLGKTYIVTVGHALWYEVDPSTVGQYTGLQDKNGKRIFEGDICKNMRNEKTALVTWHGTMAGYVCGELRGEWGELFRAQDKLVVIGNIHDNPELMQGGLDNG